MFFLKTLSAKLIVLLFFILTAAFGALSYITTKEQNDYFMENVLTSADRMSDIIRRAVNHGMLLNEKEHIGEIIQDIGGEPGIEAIRIYNKRGKAVHTSALTGEAGPVNLGRETCRPCHAENQALVEASRERRYRIVRTAAGERALGLVTPIPNQAACSSASCHAHPANKKILGVLDVQMSLAEADGQLRDSRRTIWYISAAALILTSGATAAFLLLFVHAPIRKLTAGTRSVAAGDLEHRIDLRSRDEISELGASFNEMTRDLRAARDERQQWSEELERRVKEATDELEKMQAQIIQVEKLASLGKLSATVAHELNNPMAGISTYAKLAQRQLRNDEISPEKRESLAQTLQSIFDESARCGEIVKNLLLFSRQQEVKFKSGGPPPGYPQYQGGQTLRRRRPADLRRQPDETGFHSPFRQREGRHAQRRRVGGRHRLGTDAREPRGAHHRHRRRHTGGHSAVRLRALRNDKSRGDRRGPRPLGGPRDNPAPPREHRRGISSRRGHDLYYQSSS